MSSEIDPKLTRIALILVLGMTAPAIGATIINVAINALVEEFHTDLETAQWLTTGYILMMGVGVPLSTWLVSRFDGKRVFLYSLIGFALASIAAVFAWDIGSLIAFRVAQGFAVGILMPVMQTLLVLYADGKKLGSLMAMIAIPAAIFPILGPTLGGLIANYLPWQWLFIVPLPISILGIAFSLRLPAVEPVDRAQKLDFVGLLLLTGAFCALIFGITKLRGTDLPLAWGLIGGGLVLIVVYSVYVLRSKTPPLLDIRLFARRNFTMSTLLVFVYGAISTAVLFILPLYFQQIHGETSLVAGLLLVPQGVGMFLTRSMAGKATESHGAKPVILAGVALTLAGTVPLALIGNATSLLPAIIFLLVRGAGLGLLSVPVMTCVYDDLDLKETAQGTTSMRIFQQIGGALGTAVLAIVLSHALAQAGAADAVAAYNTAYWWSVGMTAACALPALLLSGKKKQGQGQDAG
jgi:EmrB/QacA subfamily drug resistance transporter